MSRSQLLYPKCVYNISANSVDALPARRNYVKAAENQDYVVFRVRFYRFHSFFYGTM